MEETIEVYCPLCGTKQLPTKIEDNEINKYIQRKISISCTKCYTNTVTRSYR